MEEQIRDMKEHESKLMAKTMEFSERLARLETREDSIQQTLEAYHNSLPTEISKAIESSILPLQHFITEQQRMQNDIIKIQGQQGEQIERIQNAINEFTAVREKMSNHEARIATLEKNQQTNLELKKERTKGFWTVAGAIVAAVSAVITAIIAAVL